MDANEMTQSSAQLACEPVREHGRACGRGGHAASLPCTRCTLFTVQELHTALIVNSK